MEAVLLWPDLSVKKVWKQSNTMFYFMLMKPFKYTTMKPHRDISLLKRDKKLRNIVWGN